MMSSTKITVIHACGHQVEYTYGGTAEYFDAPRQSFARRAAERICPACETVAQLAPADTMPPIPGERIPVMMDGRNGVLTAFAGKLVIILDAPRRDEYYDTGVFCADGSYPMDSAAMAAAQAAWRKAYDAHSRAINAAKSSEQDSPWWMFGEWTPEMEAAQAAHPVPKQWSCNPDYETTVARKMGYCHRRDVAYTDEQEAWMQEYVIHSHLDYDRHYSSGATWQFEGLFDEVSRRKGGALVYFASRGWDTGGDADDD